MSKTIIISYRRFTTLKEQISGWDCILMTNGHSSRCWKTLYMYEIDLLWISRGWGVPIILQQRKPMSKTNRITRVGSQSCLMCFSEIEIFSKMTLLVRWEFSWDSWDPVSWDLMTKSHETACWDCSKPPKTLFGRFRWRSECTGCRHWRARSVWGLVHRIIVFCLLWRRDASHSTISYNTLLYLSIFQCSGLAYGCILTSSNPWRCVKLAGPG